VWQRVFWAVLEGIVAAALLVAGGLGALQTATIAAALPFAIVMVLMCVGLTRALRVDQVKRLSLRDARVRSVGGEISNDWKRRLRTLVHQPRRDEVLRFMRDTVKPALEAVATELRGHGIDVHVAEEEGPPHTRVWVEVRHGEEIDFFYSVHLSAYEPPSFVMRDTRRDRMERLRYFRAEVHLREGGQDYDVMGWSRDDLLSDVLDQYERHMHFLDALR